jgi:Fis family transcriptional regulator
MATHSPPAATRRRIAPTAPRATRAAPPSSPEAPATHGPNGQAVRGGQGHGETIEDCVLRTLQQYFADLDGATPHALHDMVLQAVERPLLRFALERAGGNQSAAADLLGINRNTLRKKLVDYRLV